MTYTKRIVCLANSRKHYGRCIAGKEVNGNSYGGWIRPVTLDGSIPLPFIFKIGNPDLLEIWEVPLEKPMPAQYQSENHKLAEGFPWRKFGQVGIEHLPEIEDRISGPLWENGHSSGNGLNDRVPTPRAAQMDRSLYWVELHDLVLHAAEQDDVRATFGLAGQDYKLKVTDIAIMKRLHEKRGEFPIPKSRKAYGCISLSEDYKGHCYKLLASILFPGGR